MLFQSYTDFATSISKATTAFNSLWIHCALSCNIYTICLIWKYMHFSNFCSLLHYPWVMGKIEKVMGNHGIFINLKSMNPGLVFIAGLQTSCKVVSKPRGSSERIQSVPSRCQWNHNIQPICQNSGKRLIWAMKSDVSFSWSFLFVKLISVKLTLICFTYI